MKPEGLKRTYLSDYRPPPFEVPHVHLSFDLDSEVTTVVSELALQRRDAGADQPLVLLGNRLELDSVHLDEHHLVYDEYRLDGENLIIEDVPDVFSLRIVNRIRPADNRSLNGLYLSGDVLTTQCEAEGFRSITYFPDRPDVLSSYTVSITACKSAYPVILSNGEKIGGGDLPDGRHHCVWRDPHPKPCYLFALVAGKLDVMSDSFTTASGNDVRLEFYAPQDDLDKCSWAMDCLKRAMRWDEQAYGRQYDLNRYMIVAVDEFNMGAMENKGLNIFNSKYVYAKPGTATDADYHSIEAVIAHEYFHNWSGNRVTLRDWFQLSLKEGFTIYREQQFSSDMGSPTVQRIRDANMIKVHQFREDKGPTSHPVQPDSYVTINNFYTLTIYNKGAELIRMLHVMLGPEAYRKGADLYFERHDGHAATIDDFVAAMEDASGLSLKQFKRWYKTAGTPILEAEQHFDQDRKIFSLTLKQRPGGADSNACEPLHIPVKTALISEQGENLPLRLHPDTAGDCREMVLDLCENKQTFEFHGIESAPVPSLLRGFSAPVDLSIPLTDKQLHQLMIGDTDGYGQWDAAQLAAKNCLLRIIENGGACAKDVSDGYLDAFEAVLRRAGQDNALVAMVLSLPSELAIGQQMTVVDPNAIHHARKSLAKQLGLTHYDLLLTTYLELLDFSEPQGYCAQAAGRRLLRNLCLSYLITVDTPQIWSIAHQQFERFRNMTDTAAALQVLADSSSPMRDNALDIFYKRYAHDPLVIDKWLRIQATTAHKDTLKRVMDLTHHPAFSINVPNRVTALIGAFCNANPYCFHAADGTGYDLLADFVLEIDASNPQLAARLAEGFSQFRRFTDNLRSSMQKRLQRIESAQSLSVDLAEMVEMILASAKP